MVKYIIMELDIPNFREFKYSTEGDLISFGDNLQECNTVYLCDPDFMYKDAIFIKIIFCLMESRHPELSFPASCPNHQTGQAVRTAILHLRSAIISVLECYEL